MPNPFAAIEARVNQHAVGILANAEADFGGGLIVSGVFDEFPAMAFDLVNNPKPQFRCLQSAISSVLKNAAVTIRGISYTCYAIDRDGTGLVTIDLNKA
jgi:hypothetical protein